MTGFNVRVNHHVSPTQSAPIKVTNLCQKLVNFDPHIRKKEQAKDAKEETLAAFTAITG